MTSDLQALLDMWEQRSRSAHPSDSMLINKHIRELRELDATAAPVVVGVTDEQVKQVYDYLCASGII